MNWNVSKGRKTTTQQQQQILSDVVRILKYIHDVLCAKNQNLKIQCNMKKCITATSGKSFKSDKLGQNCQAAHADVCCLSKVLNHIAV